MREKIYSGWYCLLFEKDEIQVDYTPESKERMVKSDPVETIEVT